MEFVEGKDLDTIIREKGPIPIPDILVIAKKLFTALARSHKNGVIHRDIKPGNIMITYENEIKVVDFGIAVMRGDSKKEVRDLVLGTPAYMCPEQIKNFTADHLSDIYSAGVTIFYLLTGIVPFNGSSNVEIMEKHLYETVPSMKAYRSDIPEKLIQIIETCMEKNKNDRYQSVDQVIAELDVIKDKSGKPFITSNSRLNIFDTI
jgi:serine/threonine-protein kinase